MRPLQRLRLFGDRTPIILQDTITECGLACLGMVASSYGQHALLRELRLKFPVALSGMTLEQLADTATSMGLASRPVRLELIELAQLRTPAILHWNLDHFVTLVKCTRKKITIIDPALGKRTYLLGEVSKHFTGVALELWPAINFEANKRSDRIGISTLWSSLSGLGPALLNILLLSFIIQAVSLLLPLQTQLLVDQAIARNDIDFSFMIIIGFAALSFFTALGSILRNFLSLKLAQSLAMGMRSNLVNHLLSLPLEFFQKRQIGDVLNRLDALQPVQNMLQANVIGLLVDGSMAVATLLLLMAYGTTLTLLVIGSIVAANLVDFILIPYRKTLSHEAMLANGRQSTLLIEMIKGIQPLRLFDRSADRFSVWQTAYARQLRYEAKSAGANYFANFIQHIVEAIFNAFIIYLAVAEVMADRFTIGVMISFLAYRSYFAGALNGLVDVAINYSMLEVSLERLADITQTQPEEAIGRGIADLKGRIEFRDVWFRYHAGMPWILQDVCLLAEPGEHIAISGISGAGKTTMLKLLLRVYEPERGEILIDGFPLRSLCISAYRRHIGTVMQNDELFSGSIAENACLFEPQPDILRVKEVCRLACLDGDIDKMPMGYMTLIGDMGSTLSGGQKQRLLLARALYNKPSLLLFDEATSHLDEDNEQAVNKNLKSLKMTRVTIAHRQETLRDAERLFRLEDAKLWEVKKIVRSK